ncbi:hypothetical protein FHG55_27375 [Pseudomonas jessenii]|uniref:Uncharacterized protein n=1 Tax=Pseudomonas jessenii TaxID=77298 RepID=A0A5C4KR97_PSEJE|nr:hypothetical protein FHG55_27375 [Pseudomonas jessenii]
MLQRAEGRRQNRILSWGEFCVRLAPHPSPLPEGEGADRGVWRYTSTLKDLIDYGFGKADSGRGNSQISPNQSPLPPGEG